MQKTSEGLADGIYCQIKEEFRETFELCSRVIEVDKHPKVRDEVVSVFIAAMLGHIVTRWEGFPYIRNKVKPSNNKTEKSNDEFTENNNEEIGPESSSYKLNRAHEDDEEASSHSFFSAKGSIILPALTAEVIASINDPTVLIGEWKFHEGDHLANITFKNGNRYKGRMSRNVMHGEGEFYWANGTVYTGDFTNGAITGKGKIQWPTGAWYNGEVYHGFRHGYGLLVIPLQLLYIGFWDQGSRHGEGLLVNNINGLRELYDVTWTYGKCNGYGLRVYSSGSQYEGEWKNGIQHGYGTMIWDNGDVYIGNWVRGNMEGLGKYTWNSLMNNSFSIPARNCYFGMWNENKRNGVGILDTICGVTVRGEWKSNAKHGYGEIICRNGIHIEGSPLFVDDNLADVEFPETHPWNFMIKTDNYNILKCDFIQPNIDCEKIKHSRMKHKISGYKHTRTSENSLAKISAIDTGLIDHSENDSTYNRNTFNFTPVLLPSEYIDLTYYIIRLTKCTRIMESIEKFISNKNAVNVFEEFNCPNLRAPLNRSCDMFTKYKVYNRNDPFVFCSFESECIRSCILSHLPYLRRLYHDYSAMLCKKAPNYSLLLPRLLLWQLLRDCLYNTDIILADLDQSVQNIPASKIQDAKNPFEKLKFFQFLHYLIELSWQLYGKENVGLPYTPGVLASALEKLIEENIKPYARNHIGAALLLYRDLFPLHDLYANLYCKYSNFTIRTFLSFVLKIKEKSYLRFLPNPKEPMGNEVFTKPSKITKTVEYKNVLGIDDQIIYKVFPLQSWVEKMVDTIILPVKFEDIDFEQIKKDMEEIQNQINIENQSTFNYINITNQFYETTLTMNELGKKDEQFDNTPSENISEKIENERKSGKIQLDVNQNNYDKDQNQNTTNDTNISSDKVKISKDNDNEKLKFSLSNINIKVAMKFIKEVCPRVKSGNLLTNIDYNITFLEFYELLILCALESVKIDIKTQLAQQEQLKKEEVKEETIKEEKQKKASEKFKKPKTKKG